MADDTYRTIQGDTFDAVAYRLWGDEHLARLLMEANPEHLDILVFGAGVVLHVPSVSVGGGASGLPPWYEARA